MQTKQKIASAFSFLCMSVCRAKSRARFLHCFLRCWNLRLRASNFLKFLGGPSHPLETGGKTLDPLGTHPHPLQTPVVVSLLCFCNWAASDSATIVFISDDDRFHDLLWHGEMFLSFTSQSENAD